LQSAKRQGAILWLVLINILTGSMPVRPLLTLVFMVVVAYFTYRLATAMDSDAPWMYTLLSPIPLLGIICLVILNGRATGMLRTSGLRVGLMGVPPRQVRALAEHWARQRAPSKTVATSKRDVEPIPVGFKFSCPNCSQHLACNERWSGIAIQCPSCEA
jgi:hypothetical protein